MKYRKPPLTFEKQAEQLIAQGLTAEKDDIIEKLGVVSYYRLSTYWRIFTESDDMFKPDTDLNKIWRIYVFDRQLRLLVMDAVERVEISVRTLLVNKFALKYGPFGYLDKSNFAKFKRKTHEEFIKKIRRETKKSQESFVTSHLKKYAPDKYLPLWKAAEIMPFGSLLTFFRNIEARMKKGIAHEYEMPAIVFESWVHSISSIRNICAHHGRLWNRDLGVKPEIPEEKNYPEWHSPVKIDNEKVFGVLTILYYLLKQIAPKSQWKSRLIDLFDKYNDIPINQMGFPDNWKDSPLWE